MKKFEKIKKNILFRKKIHKITWPRSAKSDKFFLFKKKKKHKTTMAHECQI